MRILHLTKKYPNTIGGDALVVYNLKKEQEANHEVYVLVPKNSDSTISKNVYKFGIKLTSKELDTISFRRLVSTALLLPTFIRVSRAYKPDVIHIHAIEYALLISPICKIIRVPTVLTLHTGLFVKRKNHRWRRIIEKFILSVINPTIITTVAQRDIKNLDNRYKIKYIPNGIDNVNFRHAICKKNTDLLFVGRLEKEKGIEVLLKSLMLMKLENMIISLKVVGAGSQENQIKKLVNEYGLSQQVSFEGIIDNEKLSTYYQRAKCFVLPAIDQEAFGIVVLEALACGIPAIVTNKVGLESQIIEHQCGIVIPSNDPESLVKAIKNILTDEKVLENMGTRGQEMVYAKYSWTRVNEQVENLYRNIL